MHTTCGTKKKIRFWSTLLVLHLHAVPRLKYYWSVWDNKGWAVSLFKSSGFYDLMAIGKIGICFIFAANASPKDLDVAVIQSLIYWLLCYVPVPYCYRPESLKYGLDFLLCRTWKWNIWDNMWVIDRFSVFFYDTCFRKHYSCADRKVLSLNHYRFIFEQTQPTYNCSW